MNFRPTVVFDLDGTLADTVDNLLAALNRTLERCGMPVFGKSAFERLSGRGGGRATIAYSFKAQGEPLTIAQRQALFADPVKDYDLNIVVHSRLYPGALRRWRPLGLQIGCALLAQTGQSLRLPNSFTN